MATPNPCPSPRDALPAVPAAGAPRCWQAWRNANRCQHWRDPGCWSRAPGVPLAAGSAPGLGTCPDEQPRLPLALVLCSGCAAVLRADGLAAVWRGRTSPTEVLSVQPGEMPRQKDAGEMWGSGGLSPTPVGEGTGNTAEMPQMLLGPPSARSTARPKARVRGGATSRTHWCLQQNSSLGNWGNWEGL